MITEGMHIMHAPNMQPFKIMPFCSVEVQGALVTSQSTVAAVPLNVTMHDMP
jgi:predicted molibdopterin-dependent oxidoreductase YjgC